MCSNLIRGWNKGLEQSIPDWEGLVVYQLVGKVMAYQGDDG